MDENADRAQVHGQQPVPERDIEPLWPPDPADPGAGGAVPPWAAVAQQRGAPSVAPGPVTPPVAVPPTGRPPVPGQPGAPAQPPPSPSDYPSLTGAVPAPGGWDGSGPSAAASGWAPAQPSWPPADPAAPTAASTPPAPPAAGTPRTPGTPSVPGTPVTSAPRTPGTPATGTPVAPGTAGAPGSTAGANNGARNASSTTAGATGSAAGAEQAQAGERGPTGVVAAPIPPGGVDLDLPFTLDRPAAAATPTDQPTAAPTPTDRPNGAGPTGTRPAATGRAGAGPTATGPAATGPAAAGPAGAGPAGTRTAATGPTATGPTAGAGTPAAGPATAGPAAAGLAPQADGTGDDGPAGAARPVTESPWAYPPQRPAGAPAPAHEQAATAAATPPLSPPADPQPPHPGHSSTPVIPGQAGPGHIPPPPDLTQFSNLPQQAPQQAGPAAPPPGPFPPSPGWYPPPWQQGTPGVQAGQPYQEAEGATRVPTAGYPDAAAYPDASWTPEETAVPTAEDFSRRRQVRPVDPVATMGVRAMVNRTGLLRLSPGRHEQELKRDIEMVRRNFGGLRQVTVVNPKGGAGKTVAILLLAMTFGQKRGGYVLAWDNNETQGTLGMRAQQDFHSRTVRDMLRDLGQFQGAHGRVGDLSQYVRSQGEGMFDVLASDESATGGEMLTAAAFAEIREVVSRFYKLIFVDTGNNVRAQNWQASMDATDQLVVTMSARNDSAETAARMLDHLEQSGRQRLVRQAVTVVSMPPSRKEIDLPAIQEHFAARTRAVLLAPYERLIDTGEPIRYGGLSTATRDAWLKIAAAVAEGL
ncbi:chromosome partitioning protein [Micromonospora sp. NPDC049230]|uniref:MinD/ParA family ATP-binding protein n=1 Tax=Micromonospora sp. NPDC049230 TaxID=3155502 RepID=UPI0033CE2A84